MEDKVITNEQFTIACELSIDLDIDNPDEEVVRKCKEHGVYELVLLIKQHNKLTEELQNVDNKINEYKIKGEN